MDFLSTLAATNYKELGARPRIIQSSNGGLPASTDSLTTLSNRFAHGHLCDAEDPDDDTEPLLSQMDNYLKPRITRFGDGSDKTDDDGNDDGDDDDDKNDENKGMMEEDLLILRDPINYNELGARPRIIQYNNPK